MKKKTTEEFIEQAKQIHGDKYDYSLVEYVNSKTKVKIICPLHGIFEQRPNGHLDKKGCLECSGKKKLSKDEFIQKSKNIHGNKYDYSKIHYINIRNKVKIICPIHGIFEQNANSHIQGYGCSKCSYNDINEFIKKSKKIHGDKYDYSLVKYKNSLTKVIIICPEHGEFTQLPYNHLNGKGCKDCCTLNKRLKNDEFIQKSNFIHGDKYDYSLVNYKDSKTKVKIICKKHGVFEQKPNYHLNGQGCARCFNTFKLTTTDFIIKSKEIHDNKYNYTLVNYINSKIKVKIICPIHGVFEQMPNCHTTQKQGCPLCKESKGERIIRQFLLKNNIIFIKQKTFSKCLSDKNKKLKFDFYLPDYNMCIEYDGEQHNKVVEHWGGETDFIKRKIRDNIKNEYCLKNNIRLIRINYNENIEEILKKNYLTPKIPL